MFAELPEYLKKEVLYHLEKDNFPKAKEIHDTWLKENPLLDMETSINKPREREA